MYTKYAKKIRVGTTMKHNIYGMGKCTKIDNKSKDFRYLFKFEDGTLVWMSDADCERMSVH